MKEKYGVQETAEHHGYAGQGVTIAYRYKRIVWYDTLEEAIAGANGEPIIKSVAYEVKEQE